jgi:PKD repeat protein
MKRLLLLLLIFSAAFISCKKPVNACFDFSPAHPLLSDTVSFDASCSEEATSYTWTFGDGSPDTTTTSATIKHAFPSAGYYNVYLVVSPTHRSSLRKSHPEMTRIVTVQ